MDPRIRIHTKMSWIRNTAFLCNIFSDLQATLHGVRLPAAGDAVGEEQAVLAQQQVLHQGQAHTLEYLGLRRILPENTLK
jgi:hypothetical protein